MGKATEFLKTFKPGASSSKQEEPRKEAPPLPKKVNPNKANPPATQLPESLPPAYMTVAPGPMPAESSKALTRRGASDESSTERYGEPMASSSRNGKDRGKKPSERSRDRGRGREVAIRSKSNRNRSPPASDSESEPKRRSKKGRRKEDTAVAKRKSDGGKKKRKPKKVESDSESDSNEEIVETRDRYEAIDSGELHPEYAENLITQFGCNIRKIEDWLDKEYIVLDTKDGSYNIDKLLKSKLVEPDEKEEWAVYEKKYRKWIKETPGGEMNLIPRFHKYVKGSSGPSVFLVSRGRSPFRGHRPVRMTESWY